MTSILNPDLSRRLVFLVYRSRFLVSYIVIGGLSILLEIIVFRGLEHLGMGRLAANVVGLATGIFLAYWLNVRFNFKVPVAKRNRAFYLFTIISTGSASINFLIKGQLQQLGWSYEMSRFVVAGTFFFLGYLLHRRFSFVDFKKVGVAIYANGLEDIKSIYDKIGTYPDFIHIDLIDDTFGVSASAPAAYRLEVIRAYWPHKEIQAHIMSRKPLQWIREIAPFVNSIFIHIEADGSIGEVLSLIRQLGKKAGICITMDTPIASAHRWIDSLDAIMLLTISTPGKSGQCFNTDALNRIREINHWPERRRFALCVDGGVTERNIGLLNVENVVSGSSVLNHPTPTRQIMHLQTSGSYERI